MMSPWLSNVFIDGCMREIKCKVVNAGAKLRLTAEVWSVVTCLCRVAGRKQGGLAESSK